MFRRSAGLNKSDRIYLKKVKLRINVILYIFLFLWKKRTLFCPLRWCGAGKLLHFYTTSDILRKFSTLKITFSTPPPKNLFCVSSVLQEMNADNLHIFNLQDLWPWSGTACLSTKQGGWMSFAWHIAMVIHKYSLYEPFIYIYSTVQKF